MTIYFNNGSSSFPKAPGVASSIYEFLESESLNVNKGTGENSLSQKIFSARENLCRLFNFDNPSNVVFTGNVTVSLNTVIKGFLKPGDHVIVSSMEHNAVMIPLGQMVKQGVTFSSAQADRNGVLDPSKIEELIRPDTKAVILTTASNVCGTMLPVEEAGDICRRHGLKLIVDSAQTAGSFEIDMKKMNIDVLCFTGHKSLRGPQGIGGFLITEEMAKLTDPLISGGTGSAGISEEIPDFMPDRFQAGTVNVPGIIGLDSALKYLEKEGIENISKKELHITERFLNKALDIPEVTVVGKKDLIKRTPIVSLKFNTIENAEASLLLQKNYGVITRYGIHCAPRAHKTLGTFPEGTVRFSFSSFNTESEVDTCIDAIKEIVKK